MTMMIVLTNWFLASQEAKSNFNSTDAKSAPYKLAPNLPLLNRLVMSLRLIFQVECYNLLLSHNPCSLHWRERGIAAHIHCSFYTKWKTEKIIVKIEKNKNKIQLME